MTLDQESIDVGNLLLRGLHRGYADLLSEIRSLDEAAGADTDTPDAFLRRQWHPAYPDSLAANIARNTYRHYAEHLSVLRRFAGAACAHHKRGT